MSEQNESSSGNSTLLAFMLGSAVGVIAGLLLAPRSGKETRQRLQEWMEDLEGKGEELLEEGRDLWEQGKETLQDKWQQGKETFQEKSDKVRQTVDSATRKVWGDRS